VLSYFAGEPITVENAAELVYRVYAQIVDATRPQIRLPDEEKTLVRPDGRKERHFRWTTWVEPRVYSDASAYAEAKKNMLNTFDPSWTEARQTEMDDYVRRVRLERARLGDVYFFPSAPSLGLMGIYGEIGLEQFVYYFAEYPEVIQEQLEMHAVQSVSWIEHLPEEVDIDAVFMGDDIAFKSGPLLSPHWFTEHYFQDSRGLYQHTIGKASVSCFIATVT